VFVIRLPDSTPLKAAAYSVRVSLSNGSTSETISDSTPLAIAAAAARLGEPLLFRRGLPATAPAVPTADPQFRRSERLHVELPTSAPEAVSGRLLDSLGKPLAIPVAITRRPDTTGTFEWAVGEVALSPFSPGDYVLEVTQGDASQVVAFKVVN
jgi:hypothetical protein